MHTTAWATPQGIMFSEKGQSRKVTYCMIIYKTLEMTKLQKGTDPWLSEFGEGSLVLL